MAHSSEIWPDSTLTEEYFESQRRINLLWSELVDNMTMAAHPPWLPPSPFRPGEYDDEEGDE